jgi:prevent-host-death family protein
MSKLPARVSVSAHEANQVLESLLDRVEQGDSFVITRHGRPVARLSPYLASDHRTRVAAAFAVFDRIAAGSRMRTTEIVDALRRDRAR